jgi:hypothetical protein
MGKFTEKLKRENERPIMEECPYARQLAATGFDLACFRIISPAGI